MSTSKPQTPHKNKTLSEFIEENPLVGERLQGYKDAEIEYLKDLLMKVKKMAEAGQSSEEIKWFLRGRIL